MQGGCSHRRVHVHVAPAIKSCYLLLPSACPTTGGTPHRLAARGTLVGTPWARGPATSSLRSAAHGGSSGRGGSKAARSQRLPPPGSRLLQPLPAPKGGWACTARADFSGDTYKSRTRTPATPTHRPRLPAPSPVSQLHDECGRERGYLEVYGYIGVPLAAAVAGQGSQVRAGLGRRQQRCSGAEKMWWACCHLLGWARQRNLIWLCSSPNSWAHGTWRSGRAQGAVMAPPDSWGALHYKNVQRRREVGGEED